MRASAALLFLAGVAAAGSCHADGMASWMFNLERLLGAYKVSTKQDATAGASRSTSLQNTMKSTAQSENDIYNVVAVRSVFDTYGPNGQLVDPCYQVGMSGMAAGTAGKAANSAQRAQALVYTLGDTGAARAGGIAGVFGATTQVSGFAYSAGIAERRKRHQDRYCTVSEANMGYCLLQSNGMQGGDSDFSIHLAQGQTYGWDQTEAAADFVKTVAPVLPSPVVNGCADVVCRAALAERRQQESYMSMARFSMMRFVESRTTQAAGQAKTMGGQ